jgi:hypothetical protein
LVVVSAVVIIGIPVIALFCVAAVLILPLRLVSSLPVAVVVSTGGSHLGVAPREEDKEESKCR